MEERTGISAFLRPCAILAPTPRSSRASRFPTGLGTTCSLASRLPCSQGLTQGTGKFLVRTSMTPADIGSQSTEPSLLRELARALEGEADSMENDEREHVTWDDILQ